MSAALAVGLAGGALLVAPRPRPAARRLAAVLGSRPVRRRPVGIAGSGWLRPVVVLTAGLLGGLLAGPALAFSLLVAAGITVSTVSAALAARVAGREQDALLEAVGALTAELRAGRPPPDALAAAAASACGRSGAVLRDAAATAGLGGAVPDALRPTEVRLTGAWRRPDPLDRSLAGLAAAWQVSARSGASLAEVLDRVERDLRSARRHRERIGSQLAGPRTTAVLLAVLPVLGLVLGAGMGAHPLHVLLRTGPGSVALLLGTALDGAGVWWTARIIRAAEPC